MVGISLNLSSAAASPASSIGLYFPCPFPVDKCGAKKKNFLAALFVIFFNFLENPLYYGACISGFDDRVAWEIKNGLEMLRALAPLLRIKW